MSDGFVEHTRASVESGSGGWREGTAGDAVDGVVPPRVARPSTVDEARAIVRAASESGQTLVARGRGRHLEIGAPPSRLDVLLALDGLDRVLEHHAADMTVTVEAGCTLAKLDEVLAATGQWLPLDPPAASDTTVGGAIAANVSGPLRASQGAVRDLLLGLRWIAPDGALVSGGGRVVKNVAGYDLPKAHVGALGTLGVLVDATFKVRPRPSHERALVVTCADPEAAIDLALAARDLIEPGWIELATAGVLPGIESGVAIVVGWLGLEEEVADAASRVRALPGASRDREPTIADGTEARTLRERLAGVTLTPDATTLKAATLPASLGALLSRVERTAREAGTRTVTVAHAANGVARIVVREPKAVAAMVAALRPALEADGGSLVVERAIPDVKHSLADLGGVWGAPGPAVALMRGLKASFDPSGTLAPGRFVAGI